MSRRRIYYFGLVSTEDLNRKFGQQRYIGAADGKMFAVARALRSAGYPMIIVSPVLSEVRDECRAVRTENVPFVRAWAIGRRSLRRLAANIGFLGLAASTIRRIDVVVVYNFFPDYILLACFLRLLGRPLLLDIEDAPRLDESGYRGWATRISFRILKALAGSRWIVASHSLARSLRLDPMRILAVYGAIDPASFPTTQRFRSSRIAVLYGGTIRAETGAEIFASALCLLSSREPHLVFDFHVTGNYDRAQFASVVAALAGTSITLTLHQVLSADEYTCLLEQCDVGLSLNLSSSGISDTTFPSKIVGIAAAGLLVCATPVSDVPLIFDDSTAALVHEESSEGLADVLSQIAANRTLYALRAAAGQSKAREEFGALGVGKRMGQFLFDTADGRDDS